MDHYAILEISINDTTATIRDSYKRLALLLHPDKNSLSNTTTQFQRLNQAWEVLRDDQKRASYNQTYIAEQRRKEFEEERARAMTAAQAEGLRREKARREKEERKAKIEKKRQEWREMFPELPAELIKWSKTTREQYAQRRATWRGRKTVLEGKIKEYSERINNARAEVVQIIRNIEARFRDLERPEHEFRPSWLQHQTHHDRDTLLRTDAALIRLKRIKDGIKDEIGTFEEKLLKYQSAWEANNKWADEEEARETKEKAGEACKFLNFAIEMADPYYMHPDRLRKILSAWKSLEEGKVSAEYREWLNGKQDSPLNFVYWG